MRALVIPGPNRLALSQVPDAIRPGECRIRVRRAGICGTDLQLVDGYAAFAGIPGHEFVGVVEDVTRAEDRPWIGRRVVGDINVGCGSCDWCARGLKAHCPGRSVLGIRGRSGAFAEAVSLPAANLHPVPDSVPDDVAVFVEPTAAACQILAQIPVDPAARIAVVGDGRLGLLVAQVLAGTGASVVVYGRHEEKLDIARTLGLTAALAPTGIAARDRVDIVVDATGRPGGLDTALQLVRPRGTVVLKSTFHGAAPAALWPIVVDEVTVVGSRCGPFPPAIDLLQSGAVSVAPLVSHVLPLEECGRAFDLARRHLKVLFAI